MIKERRLGRILASLAAVLLFSIIAVPSVLTDRAITGYADQKAKQIEGRKDRLAQTMCAPAAPATRAECVSALEQDAAAALLAERNLAAQQSVSLWTRVMGLMAVAGAVLSALGIFLVWQTWTETRRAATTSERTYDAFISLERARLNVVVHYLGGQGPNHFGFQVLATNVGKATAVVTQFLWADRASSDFAEIEAFLLPPVHIVIPTTETKILGAFNFTAEQLQARPYLGGMVRYGSALGLDHKAYFCFQLESKGPVNSPVFMAFPRKGDDWPADL